MRLFAVALLFVKAAASYGQAPQVPHKMQFAGITLTIRDDARREIQKDVDALTKQPRYFGIKVERAKTYFPIIEKIFAEERLPDDFKFLALQESSLISDAVSVTNAVGFWQFKDFTAVEMGLRMDKDVDERMNLISATRSAAKYIKQNNTCLIIGCMRYNHIRWVQVEFSVQWATNTMVPSTWKLQVRPIGTLKNTSLIK